jgi:hypothetical protein
MPKRAVLVVAAASVALIAPTAAARAVGAAGAVTGQHPGRGSFFAPPPEGPVPGPAPIPRPSCKAGQIEAAAFTESTPGGVLGVVELEGTKFYRVKHVGYRRCKLPITKGPRSFVGASGDALPVPRGRADTTNPANNSLAYLALADGKASWGFGWFGSYCGEAPRYVVMKLSGRRGTLDVPYDGPTPGCPAHPVGPIASTLTDGEAGAPGEAVQPAPPSYVNLTTSAQFVGTTTPRHPARVDVTISDSSSQPVKLMPCPIYLVETEDNISKPSGWETVAIDGSTPGCRKAAVTVTPGQPVTFRVPPDELSPGTRFSATKGSTLEIRIELAGMPTAAASATVR